MNEEKIEILSELAAAASVMLGLSKPIRYSCIDGKCVQDPNGIYKTLEECKANCKVPSNIYYVAFDGNDNNSGTESQPFRTIQKSTNVVNPGELVYVKQGIYSERVKMTRPGSVNNYIIFKPYPGHQVTIDGTNIPLSWQNKEGLVEITDVEYVRFSGFKVQKSVWNGIATKRASNIIIDNNHTYDTRSSGIWANSGNNFIIDNNEVELAANSTSIVEECISISAIDIFEIKNNYVHHSGTPQLGAEGIDAKSGCSNGKICGNKVSYVSTLGIYADAGSKYGRNIEIFNNLVHHNKYGIAISGENGGTIENIKIYNNVVYENNSLGIYAPAYGNGPIKSLSIINNTCYKNGSGITFGLHQSPMENVTVRNNICSQNGDQIKWIKKSTITGVVIGHNLIDGFSTDKGTDYIIGDPQFVNAVSFDLHLKGISPAIDVGSSLDAPMFDYDNKIRPKGAGYDIGAFEY